MPVGTKENDETAEAATTVATRKCPKVGCILGKYDDNGSNSTNKQRAGQQLIRVVESRKEEKEMRRTEGTRHGQ